MKNLRMMLTIVMAFSAFMTTAAATNKVVYGDDNRMDVKDTVNRMHHRLAQSTAAMMSPSRLETQGETTTVNGSLLSSRGICSGERFADQVTAAACSGFLVAPDLMVTAGHCVRKASDCENSAWVFDFKVDHGSTYKEGESQMQVPTSSVYNCKEIVERELSRFNKNDYALIRLTREVTDREPLTFRRSGKISDDANLVVIGHPSGLPSKVSPGAWVRNNGNSVYFSSNLDTFGGNSGSAVFNADTGDVEGILVRGASDYRFDPARSCRVPNECEEDGCRGEDVTRITNIEHLKAL